MITDRQVKKLWKLLSGGLSLVKGAARCDMDEKTARKYRHAGKLPSELAQPHTWRTREDPFRRSGRGCASNWQRTRVCRPRRCLSGCSGSIRGEFDDWQLRTLPARVKRWRATAGRRRRCFSARCIIRDGLCASDFTHMNSLGVTIGGQPFEHLVYHFVLTYSNWESITICFSESFESLSEGPQNAAVGIGRRAPAASHGSHERWR